MNLSVYFIFYKFYLVFYFPEALAWATSGAKCKSSLFSILRNQDPALTRDWATSPGNYWSLDHDRPFNLRHIQSLRPLPSEPVCPCRTLSSMGTGSTLCKYRPDSWNGNMMGHPSKHWWNVIHIIGTPMEHDPHHGNTDGTCGPKFNWWKKNKEERPHEKFSYLFYYYYFRTF